MRFGPLRMVFNAEPVREVETEEPHCSNDDADGERSGSIHVCDLPD